MAEKSRSELNTLIDKPFKKGNEDLATKLKAIVESAPNLVDDTGGVGGLSLGETNTTAYRGDRGKTAYDHSQTSHAPANAVTQANNYTDSLASAVYSALDGKANASHVHTSSDISDFNEAVDARIPAQITQQIIEGLI